MSRVLPAYLLLLCAACGPNDLGPGRLIASGLRSPLSLPSGAFEVQWTGGDAPALRIQQDGRTIWESLPGRAFVTAGRGREKVHESRGLFSVEDSLEERCVDQIVTGLHPHPEAVEVRGTLSCREGEVAYSLRFTPVSERQLGFTLEVKDPRYNRVALTQSSSKDEGVYGFGEQFSWFDHKRLRVPILVSEQGIGRGAFPITLGANLSAGAGGNGHTTYAAVPHFLTSRLRSLFLENTEVSTFDLRDEARITVELFSSTMRGRIVAGTTPLELIEEYTTYAGRMRRLPDWMLEGAVVGMQGGTAKVREVLGKLREKDVPVAALWLQDWVGQRTTSFGKQLWWNWELDTERYPEWPELMRSLEAQGIRVMTYVNPFLADVEGEKASYRRNLFAEAKERGYLVHTPEDAPYLIQNTSFSAGLVDLTSPEARRWMKDVLRDEVLGVGASGWMADFGEALPYDARLADGDAKQAHNAYPEEWARLNRELLQEVGREEDVVFFMRSGFTRSPRYSTLFWLGDQLVSWVLVGSELLVAPVLDPGVEKVRVYLPAGRWVHVWSDREYGDEGQGTWVTVEAPMGRPAVFHKEGSEAGNAFRARLREDRLR
jgi:alpha-glucosidase (family GH31 glycosyl hydrolase)